MTEETGVTSPTPDDVTEEGEPVSEAAVPVNDLDVLGGMDDAPGLPGWVSTEGPEPPRIDEA